LIPIRTEENTLSFENELPVHKCGLILAHNEYKNCYQTLEDYLKYFDKEDELTPEELMECLRTDSYWSLHWYPDNPVGFNTASAPTLEGVLHKAKQG
jgi:hypothetical protein